jgi:hypothetical protein
MPAAVSTKNIRISSLMATLCTKWHLLQSTLHASVLFLYPAAGKCDLPRLLDKTDGLETKMGIPAPFNKTRSGLDRLAKPNVIARHTQHFTAGFVIFDNLKAKTHRIESSGKNRFMAKRVEFRHLRSRCHAVNALCIISAAGG